MALLYGAHYEHQGSGSAIPHIFGFLTTRTVADDGVFEVRKGSAVGTRVFRLTMEGQIQGEDGTLAKPTYSFANDKTSGLHYVASNNLGLVINGVKVVDYSAAAVAITGSLAVSGAGAFGTTVKNYHQIHIGSTFTSGGASSLASKLTIDGSLVGAVGDTNRLVGLELSANITTQGTDTNILVVSQLWVNEPVINNNLASSGKPDVAATVYIASAPTEGDINAALYVALGSVFMPIPNTVSGTGLMVTDNNGNPQEIMRDSSSARFKEDIEDAVIDVRAVLAINSKRYGRKGATGSYLGFIVEDFHGAGFGDILAYDDRGPAGFLEFGRGITALHHAVLQSQDDRIAALESELTKMRAA